MEMVFLRRLHRLFTLLTKVYLVDLDFINLCRFDMPFLYKAVGFYCFPLYLTTELFLGILSIDYRIVFSHLIFKAIFSNSESLDAREADFRFFRLSFV